MVDWKFEIFMNLILFRNIISTFWTEEFSQEILVCLIQAGMVLTKIRIWRDFIISRDSDVADKQALEESINPTQKRRKTIGRIKAKTQSHDKVNISKNSETKKEEPDYDFDRTISAEDEMVLKQTNSEFQFFPKATLKKNQGQKKTVK